MTTKDILQDLLKGQRVVQEDIASLKGDFAVLREEMKKGFKETHERLDKQGRQLAYLEDDAPTREEFDELKKRVRN